MIDFAKLYRTMEMRRADNQLFSYPFIVELQNKDKIVVWFSYKITGKNQDSLFTHVSSIYTVDSSENITQMTVAFDVPFIFSEKPKASYTEYTQSLEQLYLTFSEEEMNALLQEKAYQPLFKAYQAVRSYLRVTVIGG